jgi:5'-nucleotidase
VRILVTNDDGVHAPGLAVLTQALASLGQGSSGERHDVVVVAPLINYSGASAAVGTVFEREQIPYQAVRLKSAPGVPAFGVDGSPALAVIVALLGAFGPPPDLVVSGINLGVNVGRSILHSGTVGAVLTGAQRGLSGLAVSLRSGGEPPWETAAALAAPLIGPLAKAPPGTVLNLNVPSLPLHQVRGLRAGHIGGAAIIQGASSETGSSMAAIPNSSVTAVPKTAAGGPDAIPAEEHEGYLELRLGAAIPSLGDVGDEDPSDDAALVAAGFASLTPLVGVREDRAEGSAELLARLLQLDLIPARPG